MARTRSGQGQGWATVLEQNVPTPSSEMVLILRSLEEINETLRGFQRGITTPEVEFKGSSLREGDPKIPLNLLQRPLIRTL